MKDDLKFYGMYRALVVNNQDPAYCGRIQAKVFPMFADIDNSNLPWATPASPISSGAGSDFGTLCIPENNTYVFVFFENGDLYQPVYFAEAQTAIHGLPTELVASAQYAKGFKTKNGIIFSINDSTGAIVLFHPSGTVFTIDGTGNVTITSAANKIIAADGTMDIESSGAMGITSSAITIEVLTTANIIAGSDVSIVAAGKVDLQSTGEVSVDASAVDITASGAVNITGTAVNLN